MAGEIPFGQGMNGLASYFAGQQQAMNQQRSQADLSSIMQQQERERQMLPLDIAAKQAQLPGLAGISQQQSAAGQLAQGTLSDAIAAKTSEYKGAMSDNDLKMMGATGEKLLAAATAVKNANLPAMAQPEALRKVMAQYGIPDQDRMMQMLSQASPDKMVDYAGEMGLGMAKASRSFVQNQSLAQGAQKTQRDVSTEHRLSGEKIAAGNNATSIEVAKINAGARISVAAARNALQKPMSSDQKIVALSSIPPEERTLAENEQLLQLSKQRMAERAAGANAVPSQMLDLPTPQQNAQAGTPFANPTSTPNPSGMRQVGTSGGKPVYEDAKGNRFIGD